MNLLEIYVFHILTFSHPQSLASVTVISASISLRQLTTPAATAHLQSPNPSESLTSYTASTPPSRLPTNRHPMWTRAKSGITKLRLHHTLLSQIVPTSAKQDLSDPRWQAAMSQEFYAFVRKKTWPLVHLPTICQPVGLKWVFRVEEAPHGTINRCKVRLVASWYH